MKGSVAASLNGTMAMPNSSFSDDTGSKDSSCRSKESRPSLAAVRVIAGCNRATTRCHMVKGRSSRVGLPSNAGSNTVPVKYAT